MEEQSTFFCWLFYFGLGFWIKEVMASDLLCVFVCSFKILNFSLHA